MDKEFLSQIDRVEELLSSPTEKLIDEALICECFCVNAGDIRQSCGKIQKVDLLTLRTNYNLGTGCQGCLKRIDDWVDKIF